MSKCRVSIYRVTLWDGWQDHGWSSAHRLKFLCVSMQNPEILRIISPASPSRLHTCASSLARISKQRYLVRVKTFCRKVFSILHSSVFQKIEIQDFPQPWWAYVSEKLLEILLTNTNAFQNNQNSFFFQPWWNVFRKNVNNSSYYCISEHRTSTFSPTIVNILME